MDIRRSVSAVVAAMSCLFLSGGAARAQDAPPAPRVVEIRVEQYGRTVTDPAITSLIATGVGAPLSMRDVRETIAHLTSLGQYDDVQVFEEPAADGVRLRYVLVPVHPIDRVEFSGRLGLGAGDLRLAVRERFGVVPPAGRVPEIAPALREMYRSRGYPQARVATEVVATNDPPRATLMVEVDAGPRATIARVDIQSADRDAGRIVGAPDVRAGQPYDAVRVDRVLESYVADLRGRGFLEARATHAVTFEPAGAVVTLAIARGPRVTIAFAGDPIPESERERLVPVREEASVDQDLLEDAQNAIANYLRRSGYRDPRVDLSPVETDGELTITFTIARGPRFVVAGVVVAGNTALPADELRQVLQMKEGEPFVQARLDAGVAAIRARYRERGYTRVELDATAAVLPSAGAADDRRVDVRVAVVEGPRTTVRSVAFRGVSAVSDAALRDVTTTAIGQPFSETDVVTDRDRLDLDYRNRGYSSVVVEPEVTLADGDTQADVVFVIAEGPQVLVDHVLIVGNTRTSTQTIARELTLVPGEPLGYADVIESQRRLSALGLFRRVRITEVQHGTDARHDVLVQVEEAPPTTLGYGGGLEVSSRLRGDDQDGAAVERYDVVPRGFFEIGRRNLWGKNRSVNLFTRVALRARDFRTVGPAGAPDPIDARLGFNEYRVYGTFREPRAFSTRADLLITGIFEQAIRSSFNFSRREARAELGLRLSPQHSVVGRYSFQRTELFDEDISDADRPLIDRLFSEVRLSKFSTAFIRDTRQDPLDPGSGALLSINGDLAMRAIGSEVGFAKAYAEAFLYRQLPTARRVVLALGGRIGAAHGFLREKDGQTIEGELPASERFFAGGDTTVRGFSLDRLGNADTISATGFPTGGNGVIILNAELRVGVAGPLEAVGFVDAGNVFPRASRIDVTDLRPAAGLGGRYRSPIGPIRVDLGFNLDRRALVPGREERAMVLHISLGQAF